jgi:photosystem II stability/assembly factor-like uncharacterized protein
VFLSTNGGASWSAVGDRLLQSYVLSMTADGSNIFAGTLEGVFLLSEDGFTWKPVNNGLTNVYIRSLAANQGRIFAGTYGGGIFRSEDEGVSWTATNDGLTNFSILNFAFLASDVFAGTYGGVFRSNPSVTSWTPIDLGSISPLASRNQPHTPEFATEGTSDATDVSAPKAVYSLAVDGSDIYVGTYGMGVLRSTDDGQGWEPINSGLANLDLNKISVIGRDLYAGALDGQLWRLRLPDKVTDAGRLHDGIPTHFILDQNYPNPFNPTTAISFQLSAVSDVKLIVSDLLGHVVATLAQGVYPEGRYSVEFDAKELSSGVYFCTLRAGRFADTKRLLLLR